MSKEEILINNTDSFEADTRLKSDVLEAMQEYADQEKEKVAVAFAEWLSKNCIQAPYGFGWRIYDPEEELWVYRNPSDLYQYFITNVYNK